MRQTLIVAVVAVLFLPASPLAQGWTEYVDRTDRFSINFPGPPQIREATYQPQRGPTLDARVFAVQDGPRLYSLTVVNLVGLTQPSDVKGSVAWEAWNFRKRGGDITYDAFSQVDRIDGHQLQITNRDKSLTIVGIYVHARRLYILEATVPPGTPGAVHFQQSLIILDEAGKRVRYELDADGNRTSQVTDFTGIC
jgi:hypothetical protein